MQPIYIDFLNGADIAEQAAARHAWDGLRQSLEIELSGAGDNPALIAEQDLLLANANFDSTHLALASEALGLALSRLGVCSAERVKDYSGQALACVEKTRELTRRLRLLACIELLVAA